VASQNNAKFYKIALRATTGDLIKIWYYTEH